MTNTQDAIAAFLAKGGKVQKVAANASSGITDKQFYLAARGEVSLKADDNALINERHLRAGVWYNGLGEVIGRD